jgi:hypothetical protein
MIPIVGRSFPAMTLIQASGMEGSGLVLQLALLYLLLTKKKPKSLPLLPLPPLMPPLLLLHLLVTRLLVMCLQVGKVARELPGMSL